MKSERVDERSLPPGSPRFRRWQHFQVIAVGELFDGMSRVKKHRRSMAR